jgi:hypothetical protein
MRTQNQYFSYIPNGLSGGLIELGSGSLSLPQLRDHMDGDWGQVVSGAFAFTKMGFDVIAPDPMDPYNNPPVSLINLNYGGIDSVGYWNLADSAIKTTYISNSMGDPIPLDLGNVFLRDTNGSSLFLSNTATGQYLNTSDVSNPVLDVWNPVLSFNANAPGVSTASTSLNYIGRDFNNRIEETMAGKATEKYEMIVGQKPNADGVDIGLNTSIKTITGTFSYKDGINTSDRSDNVAATTNSKVVETRSLNSTTTADVLGESYSQISTKNVSLGGGSTDSYKQNESLVHSYSGTQTFNADSSIAETLKNNTVYSTQYSQSFSDVDDLNSNGNRSEAARSELVTRKDITSTDYANSVNVNGDYKETNKETWDYKITANEAGFFNGGSYTEAIFLSHTGSSSYLLDEQLPNSVETETGNVNVAFSYLDQEFHANKILAESFDLKISGSASSAWTEFGNGKNDSATGTFTITNFSYSEKFDFDNNVNTAATTGNTMSFVGSGSFSEGTDANGLDKPETVNVTISSGSLTRVLEDGTVDYSITTKAATLNASILSVLNPDEKLGLQADLDNIEIYLSSFQPDESNQETYFPVGLGGVFDTVSSTFYDSPVADSFENLILLGDNTITIKNGEGQIAFGGLGADTIIGGNGNDLITGGRGADIINGGLGNDVYFIDSFSGSNFGVAGTGKTFTGFDTITFSNNTSNNINNSDNIFTNDMVDSMMTLSSTSLFKAANFSTVDAVVNYLDSIDGLGNSITNNSNAYIYVTDSSAKQGAIYYFESSDLNNTVVSADEVKLLGITTGDFSTDFVM